MTVDLRTKIGIPGWWWIGLPLASVVYATLRWLLPAMSRMFASDDPANPAGTLFRELLDTMSVTAAPYAAGFFLIAWVGIVLRAAREARRLDRQTGIDSIRDLSWRDFELLLVEAFRRQGYRVADTGTGADGGVDVILTGKDGRTLVQAKQWRTRKVGVQRVRELLGVCTAQRARSGILVTSGAATEEARRFARSNGIRIVEGGELEEMVRGVQQRPRSVDATDWTAAPPAVPACPTCGSDMVRRTARRGARVGQEFWGCPQYPKCRGTRQIGASGL